MVPTFKFCPSTVPDELVAMPCTLYVPVAEGLKLIEKSFVLPVCMLKLVVCVLTTVPDEFAMFCVSFTVMLLLPVPVSAKCTLTLVDVPT